MRRTIAKSRRDRPDMAGPLTFETFRSKGFKDWRFRIVAANGEIIAQSEGYTTERACRDTILLIQAKASIAHIKETEVKG